MLIYLFIYFSEGEDTFSLKDNDNKDMGKKDFGLGFEYFIVLSKECYMGED